MPSCRRCGKPAGLVYELCRECIALGPEERAQPYVGDVPVPTPPERPPPIIGVRGAIACTAIFVIMQFVVGAVIGVIALTRTGLGAPHSAMDAAIVDAMIPALPLSCAMAAVTIIGMMRYYARRVPRDMLWSRLGFTWGRRVDRVRAAMAGALVSMIYIVSLAPHVGPHEPGVMSKVAMSGNGGLAAWITAACLAPPAEEMLFRGLALEGFSAGLSVPVAGLVSGFLFLLLHWSEALSTIPSAIGLSTFIVVVTIIRIRTRSVGPAICAHFAYNGTLAAIILLAASARS